MLSDVIESIAMMQQMQYAALRAAALAFVSHLVHVRVPARARAAEDHQRGAAA